MLRKIQFSLRSSIYVLFNFVGSLSAEIRKIRLVLDYILRNNRQLTRISTQIIARTEQ